MPIEPLPPLVVGDRVSRPWSVTANPTINPRRYGVVTEVYLGIPSLSGDRETFYEVTWDHGWAERGYLRHGLTKVEKAEKVEAATTAEKS